MASRMAPNAFWLNDSECAGEYIEVISVNMRLCSASLGCPIIETCIQSVLIPKRIKIDCDPTQNLGGSRPAHLFIILYRVENICVWDCMSLCVFTK